MLSTEHSAHTTGYGLCGRSKEILLLTRVVFPKIESLSSRSTFVLANHSLLCPNSHVGQALSSQLLTDKETEVQEASVTCQ